MSCTVQVMLNKEGAQVPSILYDALRDASKSVQTANKWYNAINSEEFKNSSLYQKLEFDENGEPTFESLYKNGFREYVDKYTLAKSYTKRLGGYSGTKIRYVEGGINEESMKLFSKAMEFNSNPENKDFLAIIKVDTSRKNGFSSKNPGYYISVEYIAENTAMGFISSSYKEKMKKYIENINNIKGIEGFSEDLFSSISKSQRFYNVNDFNPAVGMKSFNPDRILKFYSAVLNLLENNENEVLKNDLNLKANAKEYYSNEYNNISSCIEAFSKKKMRSSSASFFDSFKNIFDNEEIYNKVFVDENDLISKEDASSNNKYSFLLRNIITNRLMDEKFRTGIEEIDNLILGSSGLLSFFLRDNKIKTQLAKMEVLLLNNVSEKYEGKFDDFEINETYGEYAKFMEDQIEKASDEISEITEYQKRLEELMFSIKNIEFRYKNYLENSKMKRDSDIEELDSIEKARSIIRQLSIAQANGKEAIGIYQYILDIEDRIKALNELVNKVDEKDQSKTKENCQILKRINDFANAYSSIFSEIKGVILEGSSFSNEIVDGGIEILKSYIEDIGIAPDFIKELRKELESSNDYIVENIIKKKDESILDKMKKAIIWKYKRSERYKYEDPIENKMLMEKELRQVESIAYAIKAGGVSDISEKQELIIRTINIQTNAVDILVNKFKNKSRKIFANFLGNYMDEEQKVVKFGSFMGFNRGEKIDLEKILANTSSDINMYQRLLSSMAQAPDIILNLIDRTVKTAREEARMKYMEEIDEIKREAALLNEAGIKDTEWMFEVDENGKKTGFYVHSKITQNAYDYLMEQKYIRRELGLSENESYNPENHTKKQNEFFEKELEKEIRRNENLIKSGYMKLEESAQYKEIMKNPAKKRFFEFFSKKYNMYQSFYPNSCVVRNRCIGVRKDKIESFSKAEGGLKEKAKAYWDASVSDIARTYDDEFSTMRVDLKGDEIKMLPVYYSYFEDSEIDTLSTDCISSIMKYASKAYTYDSFSNIVDALEIGREVLKARTIEQYSGRRPIVSNKKVAQNAIENNKKPEPIKKPGGTESNFYALFNDYIETQVYGRKSKDEGEVHLSKNTPIIGGVIGKVIGKDITIPVGKVADWINAKTAKAALGFNWINGFSNLATGTTLHIIESIGGRYFNPKDWIWAEKTYYSEIPGMISECKSKTKTNKLLLFGELFDVQNEYFSENSDIEWERNPIVRIFGKGISSIFQNAGEHMMAYRTLLSVAREIILTGSDGKKYNLYEAFKVKYFDKDGNLTDKKDKYGAKLVLVSDNMTYQESEDGPIMKFDNSEEGIKNLNKLIFNTHNKVNGINHQMHGIYNDEDANAIQRYALGKLAYLFRKWIPAAINKRFGKLYYDMDTQTWREGHYTTVARCAAEFFKELKNGKKNLIKYYRSLSEEERANIVKALTEWAVLVSLMFANSKLFDDDEYDEETKNSYMYKFAKLQGYRLQSELQSMIPNIGMVEEAIRIFRSPITSVRMLDSIVSSYHVLSPWDWGVFDSEKNEHMVKSGPLKGHSLAYKELVTNPALGGYWSGMYRQVANIGNMINFYKDSN